MEESARLRHKHNQARYVVNYWKSDKPIPHGKVWAYSKLGCRCVLCKGAIREHQRKYEVAR